MCRWPAACVIVAAGSASGCGRVPVEVAGRFEPAHRPAVDIRIVLQAEHRGHASRYLAAAVTSLTTLTGWIGPYPHASLILADPPWQVPAAIESPAIVMDRAPWWASPTSMAPELATARAIARRVWSESIDTGGLPPWFTEGLVEYSARRSVAPLFQGENLGDGFAMIELRYFGGFVPRFIRIRLQPDADGDPLTAYAECPRVGGAPLSASEARMKSRISLWRAVRIAGSFMADARSAGMCKRWMRCGRERSKGGVAALPNPHCPTVTENVYSTGKKSKPLVPSLSAPCQSAARRAAHRANRLLPAYCESRARC